MAALCPSFFFARHLMTNMTKKPIPPPRPQSLPQTLPQARPEGAVPQVRAKTPSKGVNKLLVAAVAAGIIAACGWLGWDNYQDWRNSQAANLYQDMTALIGEEGPGDGLALFKQLQQQYPDSAYYEFGGLVIAGSHARAKQYEEAINVMRSVLVRSEREILRPVLTLRLGRLLIAANRMDEALALLNDGSVFTQPYVALILEQVGNIHNIRGNRKEARKAYGEALRAVKEFNRPIADIEALEMKLNDLQGKDLQGATATQGQDG